MRANWRAAIMDGAKEHYQYAKHQIAREKVLLKLHWKVLLASAIFQYIHKVCTNIAYYLHTPREPLWDLGFVVVPPLSQATQIVSEYMFFFLFTSTILFALSPFVKKLNNNSSSSNSRAGGRFGVLMIGRFMTVLMMAQMLRCVCFLLTSLPGPNYHCRPGSPDYNPPTTIKDMLLRTDAFFGCGDLVFSSHTIFVTLCGLTWQKYCNIPAVKKLVWFLVGVFGLLVVSARKHYSLDVFVALYTVPLLWIAYDHYYPDYVPSELASPSGGSLRHSSSHMSHLYDSPSTCSKCGSANTLNDDDEDEQQQPSSASSGKHSHSNNYRDFDIDLEMQQIDL